MFLNEIYFLDLCLAVNGSGFIPIPLNKSLLALCILLYV